MSTLNRAIVNATNTLIACINAEHPDTDTRLLPRRVQELVKSTIANESCHGISVTASDVEIKVNHAADALAAAHAMFASGDKVNASKLVAFAFNSPDCYELMASLSELNEDADPSDFDEVMASIDPENDDQGEDTEVMGDPTLSVDPVAEIVADDEDEDDGDEEDWDDYDPNVLAELELSPQNLDADATHDTNDLSNLDSDPSLGINLDTSSWNMASEGNTGDPLLNNFEPNESVDGLGGMPGIDQTAAGRPDKGNAEDESSLGLEPTLNPTQVILAKITDPKVKAVVNAMSMKTDAKSKAQLTAFLNTYASRHKLAA